MSADRMDRPWIRIDAGAVHDPAINLAIEEYVVRSLPRGVRALLLYVNDACVVVGKNQVVYAEADLGFLEARDAAIVRRLSGGGAVWHDRGNLNFSIHDSHRTGEALRTRERLEPVCAALRELGISAESGRRGEILVGGRKVSGTAQFASATNTFVHGTLLFDSDLRDLRAALAGRAPRVRSTAVASVPASVANLRPLAGGIATIEEFAERLARALTRGVAAARITPTAADWASIRDLAESKYRSWEWTFGRSPRFTIQRGPDPRGRTAEVTVESGRIREVRWTAGGGDTACLASVRYSRDEIERVTGDPALASLLHD